MGPFGTGSGPGPEPTLCQRGRLNTKSENTEKSISTMEK